MHRAANPLGLPAGSFFEAFLPTSLEGVQSMAMRVEYNPLEAAFAALLANGLDGAGEALRILVNEASKIERARFSTPLRMNVRRRALTMPKASSPRRS